MKCLNTPRSSLKTHPPKKKHQQGDRKKRGWKNRSYTTNLLGGSYFNWSKISDLSLLLGQCYWGPVMILSPVFFSGVKLFMDIQYNAVFLFIFPVFRVIQLKIGPLLKVSDLKTEKTDKGVLSTSTLRLWGLCQAGLDLTSGKWMVSVKTWGEVWYIYQHLQRGVKWFLKGVNSPSLRV